MSEHQAAAARARGSFPSAWTLLRVRGVPIRIDLSWLVLAGLAVLYFTRELTALLGDRGLVVLVGAAAGLAVLFFASLLAHELGHALTSLGRGIPVTGVTLFLLGGVTESASEARSARDEFAIVGIGPFISLVLAAGFGLLYTTVADLQPLAAMLGWAAWINLALAVFNVLPGYPLDGGRLLRSLLWMATGEPHKATRWAARVGQAFALTLLLGAVYGLLGGQVRFGGPFGVAATIVASGGLWGALIGGFLLRGATGAHRHARARERVAARSVREAMGTVPPTLSPELSLAAALARIQERPSLLWPVGTPLQGAIRLADVDDVPQHDWESTTVGEVARPLTALSVPIDASLDEALERMAAAPGHMVLVTDDGHAVGLLTPSLIGGFRL